MKHLLFFCALWAYSSGLWATEDEPTMPSRFFIGHSNSLWVQNEIGVAIQDINYKKSVGQEDDLLAGVSERISVGMPVYDQDLQFRFDLAGQVITGAKPASLEFFGTDTLYEVLVFPSGEIMDSGTTKWSWGLRGIHRQGFNLQIRKSLEDTAIKTFDNAPPGGSLTSGDVRTDTKRLLVNFVENRLSPLTSVEQEYSMGLVKFQFGGNFVYYRNDPDNEVGVQSNLGVIGLTLGLAHTLKFGPRLAFPVNVLYRLPLSQESLSGRSRTDLKDSDEAFFDDQLFIETGIYYVGRPNLRLGIKTIFRTALVKPGRADFIKGKASTELLFVLGYLF